MLILARFAMVRTVLVRCHSRQADGQAACRGASATARHSSTCCRTTVGDSLTPCARNSADIVDRPRPADDRRSAEVGYFFVRVSVVSCAFGTNADKAPCSM